MHEKEEHVNSMHVVSWVRFEPRIPERKNDVSHPLSACHMLAIYCNHILDLPGKA